MLLGTISFPIFVRLFSLAEYGLLGLSQKLIMASAAFSKCGLQNSALRFFEEHQASEHLRRRFYTTMYFAGLGTVVIMTLLYAALVRTLSQPLLGGPWIGRELSGPLLWGAGLVLLRPLLSIQYSLLRGEGRTRDYNIIEVFIKAAQLVLILVLLLRWETSVRAFLIGLTAVEAGVCVFLAAGPLRRGLLHLSAFDAGFARTAFRFGIPMIGTELSYMVLDAGDRILIQHYLGSTALGLYTAAYSLATYLEEALMAPLRMTLLPLFMKLWVNSGKEETARFLTLCLNVFLLGAIGICMVTTVASRDLIIVIVSDKILPASELLPALVVGLFFSASRSFFEAGLLIHNQTKTIAALFAAAAAVNVAINVVLLPRLGLRGAAIATVVSYAFFVMTTAWASAAYLRLTVAWKSVARWCAWAVVVGLACRRLDTGFPLANLLLKGGLSLAAFFGVLALYDPFVKRIVTQLKAMRRSAAGQQPPGAEPGAAPPAA